MTINIAKTVTERPTSQLPLYDAEDLTHGNGLAQIRLADQLYTLRITRAGKLILTK
ncbi:MAG: hemin uptake protein HemP [Rhodobacteraceae bacterium]|nr:hemin uptake protein HemP [Paracoccaceae bacterium]